MVQEIVAVLKNPPFNQTMTLLTFEEKKEYELLELILNSMEIIDKNLKIDKNNTAESLKAVFDFLKIIGFPSSSDRQLQEDLARGDKRLLIQILHFILTNLDELKKKYYQNKYMAPIIISDEYAGDDEIIELMNQFKESQAQFQTTLNMLEEKRQTAPQIKELEEDIKKNQSDKIQLTASISKFKKEYKDKKDFQELLEMTSRLRKEQEQDSNLEKKIAKQQYDIKEVEERIMVSQQRLLDNQKNINDNVSALKLLEDARNQRNANRDTFENLSKYEYVDKKNKLKSLEEIIRMPEVTADDIAALKQTRLNLMNDIDKLENKLKNSPLKSSELQIYRQNAMQATSAKETSMRLYEKLEKDKNLLEIKYGKMNQKFEQSKGYKFVRKDDLLQQAQNLKKKKETYQQYQKNIDKIKGETLILDRTINILKDKTPKGEEILKHYEEKNGKVLNQARRELEQLATQKQQMDESKALTLEEYSKLIEQLKVKLRDQDKKNILAPLTEEREKLKKEYNQIQPTFEKKKEVFQKETQQLQKAYDNVLEQYNKNEKVFRDCQDKYHQLNLSMKINEAMLKRCETEAMYTSKPDKRLNENYKSYQDYYKAILSMENDLLKDLREKQQKTKEAYEDNDRQLKLYSQLKDILTVKLQSLKGKK
jgi:intraflagellar transport protein 81